MRVTAPLLPDSTQESGGTWGQTPNSTNFSFPNCQNTDKQNDHGGVFRRLQEFNPSTTWYFLGRNSGRITGQTAARLTKPNPDVCSEGGPQEPTGAGGLGGCGVRGDGDTRSWATWLLAPGRAGDAHSLGHPERPMSGGNPAGRAGLGSCQLRAGCWPWLRRPQAEELHGAGFELSRLLEL